MEEFLVQALSAFVGAVAASRAFHVAILRKINELIDYVDELRLELGHTTPPPAKLPVPSRRS